jgi:multicomponent Na+:H+ antiporter subunit B
VAFAIIALLRGHNYPGGGFIGGLIAALSVVYYSLAFNAKQVREKLLIQPHIYIAFGLLTVLISFLPSIISNLALMKGVWLKLQIPFIGIIKLGTPFVFDIGVFLTVIGVTFLFYFSLTKAE